MGNEAKGLQYFKRHYVLYLIMIPGLLYFLLFYYLPMAGVIVAFKDYSPLDGFAGIFSSDWVGLRHFRDLFATPTFLRAVTNTLIFSAANLLIGFPAPILLALMINEVLGKRIRGLVQSISYLPNFLSAVVVVGILQSIVTSDGGLINNVLALFGRDPVMFMGNPKYYRIIIVIVQIWKSVGWNSIIFLAAISSVDGEQYEAAIVDGASRIRQIWSITLPSILPVVSIMFILKVGQVLNFDYELILLTYSGVTMDVADVFDTLIYREGVGRLKYSYGVSAGLLKSVFSAALLLTTNSIVKKMGQKGIW